MRKLNSVLFISFVALFLWNCRGQDGPPGPEGQPGPEGAPGPEAMVYEIIYSLNQGNSWYERFDFPEADLPNILQYDVVLVYHLIDVTSDGKDVWQLMPVTFFREEGTFMLNYDFTMDNVLLFAEANYEFTSATPPLNDIVARIVVVPGYLSPNERIKSPVNFENYEDVKSAYNLPDIDPKDRFRVN